MNFAECLEKEEGLKAFAPYSGTIFNLLTGEFEKVTKGIPVPKKTAASSVSTAAGRAYASLLEAARRVQSVAAATEGMSNKDIEKFTKELEALCAKWQQK